MWGEGRLIPVVIVDASQNTDVQNLISLHQYTPPGDVNSTWAFRRFDSKYIFLKLEFLRPVNTTIYIPFGLEKYASLVSGVMISRAMYLQPFGSGSSVAEGINKPKILIEVSAEFEGWGGIQKKTLINKYKKLKYTKKEASAMADEHISRMTEIWTVHARQ
jgi:hypothetical protein